MFMRGFLASVRVYWVVVFGGFCVAPGFGVGEQMFRNLPVPAKILAGLRPFYGGHDFVVKNSGDRIPVESRCGAVV